MKFRVLFLAVLAPVALKAATLTSVPMQGGMVMPMIAYNSALQRLTVMMPTNVPQLTPLLVSNPSDQFDPANPWFATLDPSAGGHSFSRRYGFVMDVNSEPLPANTAIWIEKTAGPAELNIYRYSTTPAPGVWEPIFGTAGTTNALYWNTMMFHPAITALPGTNGFNATFNAYLMDTGTMTRVASSDTGPMEFVFTNVDDGRPALDAGISFAVDWNPGATNYALEYASSMTSTNWTLSTNTVITINGRSAVLMDAGSAQGMYFRMRRLTP